MPPGTGKGDVIIMARSSNQKIKLLYTMQFLLQETDADHPAPTGKIVEYLAAQGIQAERKSIYDDIEALRLFGLDIEQNESRHSGGYYVASRNFELPELKLLVDSVQSSKFITHQKTTTLIRKIEKLASSYEAQLLQRQVYVSNRIKTMNESIYYNVDAIHTGISQGKKIRFRNFDLDVGKARRFRFLWLYVTLSFLFYIPVATAAGIVPMLGMLMLPKTVCYILILVTFYQAVAVDAERKPG